MGDKRAEALAERTVPKAEIAGWGYVERRAGAMSIRYNRWFRNNLWERLIQAPATLPSAR